MVFSRLPIRTSQFEGFRFRGDPERLTQGEFLGGKGFQTLTLEGENGPFSVINTHLHARYRRLQPQLNSAVRTAQMMQIIRGINELDGTVVAGGDFNCTRGDAEYRIFSGLTRAVELGDGRSYPTLSKSNYYRRSRKAEDKRVDYLFVRPGSGVLWESSDAGSLFAEPELIRQRDRSLSDHYGFQAAFDWQPVTSRPRTNGSPPFDPKIFDQARALLQIGHQEADRREREHFRSAGTWALGAVMAAGLRRHPGLDRRRFMRTSIGALAVLALAPAVGYSALARVDSDYKRNAFDDAHEILAQLEANQGRTT